MHSLQMTVPFGRMAGSVLLEQSMFQNVICAVPALLPCLPSAVLAVPLSLWACRPSGVLHPALFSASWNRLYP